MLREAFRFDPETLNLTQTCFSNGNDVDKSNENNCWLHTYILASEGVEESLGDIYSICPWILRWSEE